MIFIETDEQAAINGSLLDPHYTDRRFEYRAQTVFLREGYHTKRGASGDVVEVCSYDYSDRIADWFSDEKQKTAREAAVQKFGETKSAAFIEEYLRILYKKPNLVLVHIMSGINLSNGYPYRVYGYIEDPK